MTTYFDKLLDLFPGDIHSKREGSLFYRWVQALATIWQAISDAFDDIFLNLFISTASRWGLEYRARMHSIPLNPSDSNAFLKALVYVRNISVGGNPLGIKRIINLFTGEDPTVIELFRALPAPTESEKFTSITLVDPITPLPYTLERIDSEVQRWCPAHTECKSGVNQLWSEGDDRTSDGFFADDGDPTPDIDFPYI